MKKVILLLVDSLMPNILEDCARQRTVPALQFLKDRGRYWSDCVTVFPTMTASVDSSLVTGVYPHIHRIPGLVWYDPEERKIVNYINGWKCVYKLGVSDCAENVLYNLNEKHLSKKVTTIFEELARNGRTSASINAIVHRGNKKHRVHLPLVMNMATQFRLDREISGPDVLTLGAMVENGMNREIPSNMQDFRHGLFWTCWNKRGFCSMEIIPMFSPDYMEPCIPKTFPCLSLPPVPDMSSKAGIILCI